MTEFWNYEDALGRDVNLIKQDGVLDKIVISLFKPSYSIDKNAIRLGLVGDTHGHISLALQKLKDWVDFSGLKLDAILQVGDLGVLSSDKVSREMSLKDPDEEGFLDFFYRSKEADYFFGKDGFFSDVDFYFIDGNHDDLEFLNREYDPSTLELGFYKNLHYLPSGEIIMIYKDNFSVCVGALGFHHEKGDVKKIANYLPDILLTHVPPNDIVDFDKRLDGIKYHFFGHAHDAAVNLSELQKNRFGLNEVKIKRKNIKPGSLGFLEISENDSFFLYLPENIPSN